MKKMLILLAVFLTAALLAAPMAFAAEMVDFEPVRAPAKGPDDAMVTIIEIADFMWPFCKEVGPTFKRINEEYAGKVKFVLVPYMRKYSNDSRNAALAAWAAWEQGKFWEMHDLLFENAPELERAVLDDLARKLGLDMAKFTQAMDEMTHLPELQENLDRVHEIDIWSTPTVIINGRVIKSVQPYEKYKEAIDAALAEGKSSGLSKGLIEGLLNFLTPKAAHAADGSVFGQGTVPLYVKVPDAKPVNDPAVGEMAPDFTLPSTEDTNITLSEFRGKKNVLLTFLPAAFTPV